MTGAQAHNFESLVDLLAAAKASGYTYDFNLLGDCLRCSSLDTNFTTEELVVDELFHLEGADSSPDSRSTVYWISAEKGVKGVLIEPDGAYADEVSAELLKRLQLRRPST